MSFIVKAKVDGKWVIPFSEMSLEDAKQMKVWLLKHSKVAEKVTIVPTLTILNNHK